jgi:hypothetical protein
MATKKKSKVIESANVAEMTEIWPRVVQGSHLTVTYFEDGKSELKWDDEALTRDVNDAILSATKQESDNGNSKTGKQSKRQTSKSK